MSIERTPFVAEYLPLINKPICSLSDKVAPSITNFSIRFNGLYRYWCLSKKQLTEVIRELKANSTYDNDTSPLLLAIGAKVDQVAYPEYLRMSMVTLAMATFEQFLHELSHDMEVHTEQAGNAIVHTIPDRFPPFTSRYLSMLAQWHALMTGEGPRTTVLKEFDNDRSRRSHQIRRLSDTILEEINERFDQLATEIDQEDMSLTNEQVELVFNELAKLGSEIAELYRSYPEDGNEDSAQ